MGNERFEIDEKRLDLIVAEVYQALSTRKGIFATNFRQSLPQWNLPPELEHSPIQDKPKDELRATTYLWTNIFFERMNLSKVIMRNSLRLWENLEKRGFFSPEKVVERSLEDIAQVIKEDFQYGLNGKTEMSNEEKFMWNAQRLISEYEGDPRNIVEGRGVEEARKSLMAFKGIGTGIANLFLIYLLERGIARPTNPEDICLKVDVHKARIPLNTGAVIVDSPRIRYDVLVTPLEKAYNESARRQGIDLVGLDSALWIIGSEVCSKRDYSLCLDNCVLCDKYCERCVGVDKNSTYLLGTGDERLDIRRNVGQMRFEI